MTVREAREAFISGIYDALKLCLAILSAPFMVLRAFVRHHDFQLR